MLVILFDPEKKIEKSKCTRQALQHIMKMSDTEELMKKDIGKLDLLVHKMKKRIASRNKIVRQIDKKFHKLKFFDPLKLRADVLMWRSLINVKLTYDDNLSSFAMRQKHIINMLIYFNVTS